MKFFFLFILTLGQALAAECVLSSKLIQNPMPQLPESIQPEDKWPEAFKAVFEDLCHNLKRPDVFFNGHRAHADYLNKTMNPDTALLSLVWLHWDSNIAQELIQYKLRFRKASETEFPSPLLSWASFRIYKKSLNKNFLKQVYPKLKLSHEWLMQKRQHQDGLYFWSNAVESGLQKDLGPDPTKVASVDLSSYMALSMESLALIAAELGMTEEQKKFNQQYMQLRKTINSKLWDASRGMYFDWDYQKNSFVQLESVSGLMPLVAGIPEAFQAKSMMNKIIDPIYYNTPVPFPSIARHRSGNSGVRPSMAYLSIVGVDRYYFQKEARYLARKIIKGIYSTWKTQGVFFELYDPDRLGGIELKIKNAKESKKSFIGLTSLANALLLEYGADSSRPQKTGPTPALEVLSKLE